MFVCRHCGYQSHSDGVDCCNNTRCRHYGRVQNDDDSQKPCMRPENHTKTACKSDSHVRSEAHHSNCRGGHVRGQNNCGKNEKIQPFNPSDCCAGLREYSKTNGCPSCQERHFLESAGGDSGAWRGGNGTSGFDCGNCNGRSDMDSGNCADDTENGGYDRCAGRECYEMPEINSCGSLGFATVPFQKYCDTYDICKAMRAGTVFKALDMPYNKKIFRRG